MREVVYQVGWDERDSDGYSGTLVEFNVYSEHDSLVEAEELASMLPNPPSPCLTRNVDVYVRKVFR